MLGLLWSEKLRFMCPQEGVSLTCGVTPCFEVRHTTRQQVSISRFLSRKTTRPKNNIL